MSPLFQTTVVYDHLLMTMRITSVRSVVNLPRIQIYV